MFIIVQILIHVDISFIRLYVIYHFIYHVTNESTMCRNKENVYYIKVQS